MRLILEILRYVSSNKFSTKANYPPFSHVGPEYPRGHLQNASPTLSTHRLRILQPAAGQSSMFTSQSSPEKPKSYKEWSFNINANIASGYEFVYIWGTNFCMSRLCIRPQKEMHQTDETRNLWWLKNLIKCLGARNELSRINPLWPINTLWQHRSGSILAQAIACYLMAPSHYLNQCRLIIKGIPWHSPRSNFTTAHEFNP